MLEVGGDNSSRTNTQVKMMFGRHCEVWSDAELANLRRIAGNVVSKKVLMQLFPGRTYKAAKRRLEKVRHEMGITLGHSQNRAQGLGQRATILDPSDPGLPDVEHRNWCKQAEQSNERFVAALTRAMAA